MQHANNKQLKTINLDAEKDVISALLEDHSLTPEILGLLKAEHFYDRKNAAIYRTIQNLHDLGEPLDIKTIFDENSDIPKQYSYELKRECRHPLLRARSVHDKWTLRELIRTAKGIIETANETDIDVKEQTDKAIEDLKLITDMSLYEEDATLYFTLNNVFDEIKKRIGNVDSVLNSDYFPSFNKLTGGLKDGDYISLSGKDKTGKTSFAYSLALDFSINRKIPIGIFSLEMTKETLAWKAISYECEVEYQKLRNPNGLNKLTEIELQDVAQRAQRRFINTKIYTCDSSFTERQIKSKIKKWKKDFGVKFIVIDYIGLVTASGRFDNREREIAYLSRYFKQLSHELKITILILSQQNRQGEIAESKGLDRDSDFAFSIKKPLDEGITQIQNRVGQLVNMEENYFLITLERSRHSQQGKQFVAKYINTKFTELDLEY